MQPELQNSVKTKMARPSWRFGLLMGSIIAFVITLAITVWELIQNPGGIFRGPSGINWLFVFETAVSWFIPTFLSVSVAAALGHMFSTWLRQLLSAE